MFAARHSYVLAAVVSASLAATGLASAASAAPAESHAKVRSAHPRSALPPMAAGFIVKTKDSKPSSAMLRQADEALTGSLRVSKVQARGGNTSILVTNKRMPAARAETLAKSLEKRADVISASPNFVRYASENSPVTTDDYFFPLLKQIWDPRDNWNSRVRQIMGTTNSFPSGGFSSKAPVLWRKTTGTGQVVAVIDTGITDHPDLNNQVLPGWDFVNDDTYDRGRDGNGWDSDPEDRGDYENADESCDDSGVTWYSSWHGTHVAGIVAAQGDNSIGVVGVAPGVKILPVRVLGLCGGVDSDIAAGIRWAAGLPVTGYGSNPTPTVNANPADVINLSFGAPGACSDAPEISSAIAAARAAGSVVVAAAGNDGKNIVTYPVTPATCPGVISVGATSEYGDRAGDYTGNSTKTVYSNWGSTLDISAPGGDFFWDATGIVSTVNAGHTSPTTPTYAQYSGTSMAAPVVSAGASLIDSLGTFTPDQTEAALKAAVDPFPSGAAAQFKKCSTSICGKGIIDLRKVRAPLTTSSILGTPAVGEPLTASPGTWMGTTGAFGYQWLRDDSPIVGATNSTYTVAPSDVGHAFKVRVFPVGPFSPVVSTSTSTAVVLQGPVVAFTIAPTAKYGVAGTASATVTAGGSPVVGLVEVRRGSTLLTYATTNSSGVATFTISPTKWIGGANSIRAAFVGNGSAAASSSASTTVMVTKATSTISFSLRDSTITKSTYPGSTVTIKVAGDARPTGTVRFYDGSRLLYSHAMYAKYKGVYFFWTPHISKTGKHLVHWVYSGNGNIIGKTSASKTLTIR